MKIGLIASQGGHMTQLQSLAPAFDGHEVRWITHASARTESALPGAWCVPEPGSNPVRYALMLRQAFGWLRREKPDLLVSTGSEIAIPFLVAAKLLRIHFIFIDSLTRVSSKSVTGRVAHRLATEFYVQWPHMAKNYGANARFAGGLL